MTKYLFFFPFLDSQSSIKSRVASPVVTFPAIIVYLGHLVTASIILDVLTLEGHNHFALGVAHRHFNQRLVNVTKRIS